MSRECSVHDLWLAGECTCSPERKWARDKMLQEALEKIAPTNTNLDTKEGE